MIDLNDLGPDELFDELGARQCLERVVVAAREEDLAEAGDRTTAAIEDRDAIVTATIRVRRSGCVCGMRCVETLAGAYAPDGGMVVDHLVADGDSCVKGEALARLEGPRAAMLGLERPMLNLVGRLSGIASLTAAFVEAVSGTTAVVCDTRKTTPGLRALEKYAVRCGGGTLHRQGLWDAMMFKDSHLVGRRGDGLARTLTEAILRGRAAGPLRFVEVEVDDREQLDVVLALPAGLVDFVLLDNFRVDDIRAAVSARDRLGSRIRLEASGGIALDSIRAVAETGVERISVGALTHSAAALDVGLDLEAT